MLSNVCGENGEKKGNVLMINQNMIKCTQKDDKKVNNLKINC